MIEIKKREIEARVYFAMKAAIKGYSACICKKNSLIEYSDYLEKGVVILKSIGPRNRAMIDTMNNSGHVTCAWDEEGMTFIEDEYNDKRIDQGNLERLKFFFTWGDSDKKILDDFHPNLKNKIFKTGNSRIDVLKKPFNQFYFSQADKIVQKYGKFILFPTVFTQYNPSNVYNLGYVDALLKQGFKPGSPSIEIGKKQVEQQKKILDYVKVFFKKFSEECPDQKLIIRPHPSEKIEYWFDLIKNNKNIEVIFDDQSTCSWIAASDLLLSTNCTTAIEAFFLGKKCVNFLPFKDESVEFILPKAISKLIRDTDELIEIIKNLKNIENFDLSNEDKSIVKERLFNSFDGCSVDNIINVLNKKILNTAIDNNLNNDKFSNKFAFLYFILKRRLFNMYNSFNDSETFKVEYLLSQQKLPNFSLKEVEEKVTYFSKFMGDKKFSVKEIYPKIFSIEEKK